MEGDGREGVCVCDREGEPSVIMCTICTQVLHHDSVFVLKNRDSEEETPFLPQESVIKWNKKRTAIKIQVRKILNFLNVLEASDVHLQCFLYGIIKKSKIFSGSYIEPQIPQLALVIFCDVSG